MVVGVTRSDKQSLDQIIYSKEGRENLSDEELHTLFELTMPVFQQLKKIYAPMVEQLKQGKQTARS